MGFGRRRPPANQQGPGSQGQPSPALQYGERRAGGEKKIGGAPSREREGMWVVAGRVKTKAECGSQKLLLGCRCDGASALSGRAGSGGMAGVWAKKDLARPILLAHERESVWSVIRVPETPSKAAGPREPGAAQPRFALWTAEGRG